MGKKSPAPPPVPDYAGAAVAQGAANVETARLQSKLGNPNIYGPLGNQTISYEGDIPTIRQSLTPDAQATLNDQTPQRDYPIPQTLLGYGILLFGIHQYGDKD